MPAPEDDNRRQSAVYWPQASVDSYGAYVVSGTPTDLSVRWDFGRKESTDPQGNAITVDAHAHVDRSMRVGSALWQGTVATLPSDLTKLPGLMRVVNYFEAQDLKGRHTLRLVALLRVNSTLPTAVQ